MNDRDEASVMDDNGSRWALNMLKRHRERQTAAGFTLVELLVVMLVIVIMVSILLPSISKARLQAMSVVCQSNIRQIGISLLSYADDHDGWMFPSNMGADAQHVYPDPVTGVMVYNTWPIKVFGIWNPPVMLCPSDEQPALEHSYVLNSHVGYWNIKYSTGLPPGQSPASVVLIGEKITTIDDYYMEYGDFDRVVEPYRHGERIGSNYLYLDLHAETKLPADAKAGLDPWDFAAGLPPPTTKTGS